MGGDQCISVAVCICFSEIDTVHHRHGADEKIQQDTAITWIALNWTRHTRNIRAAPARLSTCSFSAGDLR